MNWEQIEGKWDQFKGQAIKKWGKLTDDEVDQIKGSKIALEGKLKEKYGFAREELEKEMKEFEETVH